MGVRICEACGTSFATGMGRPSARCPACRKGRERYGSDHKRKVAAERDGAYGQPCARCGLPLEPGQPIALDHTDDGGPHDYLGWSHSTCNARAGAVKSNRVQGRGKRPARPAAPVTCGWHDSPREGCPHTWSRNWDADPAPTKGR